MRHIWGSVLLALAVTIAGNCEASWLSKATGIHIDLAKPLAAAIQTPPATVRVVRPAQPAPQPDTTVVVVTDAAKANLVQAADQIEQDARVNADRTSHIVVALIIAAILMGLLAGIAGILKAATAAAVLSLVATAATGANSVLPFRDDANAARVVAKSAHALALKVSLQTTLTRDEYNSYVEKLLALASYGDDLGDYASSQGLDDLLQKLQSH